MLAPCHRVYWESSQPKVVELVGYQCRWQGDVAELDLRGVSVWHLKHVLLEEVRQTGGSEDSKIYEIEPLVIRPKGPNLICPRDGRTGTAYVDAIGDEAAGRANFMLS